MLFVVSIAALQCYMYFDIMKRNAAQYMVFLDQIIVYPIFSMRYSQMCKVYTGYHGTSEIERGLCACTVDKPLAKARGLSLRTGAQTMLYLSHNSNYRNSSLTSI